MKVSLALATLISIEAFLVPKAGTKRPAFALKGEDDAYGSLMQKLEGNMESVGSVVTQVPPPPLPPAAVEEAAVQTSRVVAPIAEQSGQLSIPEVSLPSLEVPSIDMDLSSMGDMLPIGIGVVVLLAAAAVLTGGGDEKATSSPSSSVSSTSSAVDLSIPYDAAARLAYEKAGKRGNYASFKSKYEEDTVAMVKGKQPLSIPYDAAAALAYQKAGMPGNYEAFKKTYLENAVAEVKAKQETLLKTK